MRLLYLLSPQTRLGRVGSLVAQVLMEHNVPIIVIDLDARVVNRCQQLGHYASTVLATANQFCRLPV